MGSSPYGFISGKKETIVSRRLDFGLVKSLQGDMKILWGFPMGTFRELFAIPSSRRLKASLMG